MNPCFFCEDKPAKCDCGRFAPVYEEEITKEVKERVEGLRRLRKENSERLKQKCHAKGYEMYSCRSTFLRGSSGLRAK